MNNTESPKKAIDKKSKIVRLGIPFSLIFIALYTIAMLFFTEVEVYEYLYDQGKPYKHYNIVNGVAAAFKGNAVCLTIFIIACTFIAVGLIAMIAYWVSINHRAPIILEGKNKTMNYDSYKKAYEFYKKSPLVNAILTLVLVLVWAIVDYCECITGISDLEIVGCLAVWLLIGSVVAGTVAFLTQISISATVLRTDAVLRIEQIIEKENQK